MNDGDKLYLQTQVDLTSLARQINELNLDEFINRIEKTENMGWFLQPTAMKRGHKALSAMKSMATSARALQKAFREAVPVLEKEGEKTTFEEKMLMVERISELDK